MKKVFAVLAAASLFLGFCRTPLAAQTRKAFPEDNGKALVNPGMGWMLYYYSNILDTYGSRLEPSDVVADFPGMSTVFLRLPWSFLEPEKDRFNWEIIDTPAQRWLEKGYQVAFCITATENWTRQGTPQWVFDEGAKYYEVGGFTEVDYDDPIFLAAVEHMVEKMAARYDGDPAVAFFAIGAYGMWGEGHTVRTTPNHGHSWGFETQKKYIDIYTRHFKKTQLCISDDYPGHSDRRARFPITDYAKSKGVTIKDDSILVMSPPDSWYHSGMAQLFWPEMPVILEHEHYATSVKYNSWFPDLLLKAVEDYHASFLSIHWWPREEYEANKDIITQINRRLGYRINMTEAEWPSEIRLNEAFNIKSAWKNQGVAPCYGGGYPCFTIKDRKGGILAVLVDTEFNVKDLGVDAPGEGVAFKRDVEFTVAKVFTDSFGSFSRTCPTGKAEIYFSVGTAYGTPTLALPYKGDDGHRRYYLGEITIAPAGTL
jgi:hypothetical protein